MFKATNVSTNVRPDGSRFVAFEAVTNISDPSVARWGCNNATKRQRVATHYITVPDLATAEALIAAAKPDIDAGKVSIQVDAQSGTSLVCAD